MGDDGEWERSFLDYWTELNDDGVMRCERLAYDLSIDDEPTLALLKSWAQDIFSSGFNAADRNAAKLATALGSLVDQDGCYRDNDIIISCGSHADAIARVRKARAALASVRGNHD